MTIEERGAIATLESAQDYLLDKSFNGDQGGDYMTYWEWSNATASAIAVMDELISQIYLEGWRRTA